MRRECQTPSLSSEGNFSGLNQEPLPFASYTLAQFWLNDFETFFSNIFLCGAYRYEL